MVKQARILIASGKVRVSCAVVLGVAMLLMLCMSNSAYGSEGRPAGRVAQHVVLEGESLWSVVESAYGDLSPAQVSDLVWQIRVLNEKPNAQVAAGEVLNIPVL